MNWKTLLYTMYLPFASAFLPTSLETILARKAILSTIFNNARTEMTAERIFLEVTSIPYNIPTTMISYHHTNDYLFFSILTTHLYGQWRYNMGEKQEYNKLKKIGKYKEIYGVYRNMMFIIIFMFFKDVQTVV